MIYWIRKYTNFAYLLSDQSEIVVKVAEYDSKMNFKIKKSFKGSLVEILKDVEEQAERLNDLRVVIDGSSFKRIETKSYPGASIREMVLNAICHANYFIRSNIKIEFFSDKVKITSPGGMLMYGKEASNRKQEIDRQHYTIPNQRPKDKHCGKI